MFPQDTRYFGHGQKAAVIDYRVRNIYVLPGSIEAGGVRSGPHHEDDGYCRFVWNKH